MRECESCLQTVDPSHTIAHTAEGTVHICGNLRATWGKRMTHIDTPQNDQSETLWTRCDLDEGSVGWQKAARSGSKISCCLQFIDLGKWFMYVPVLSLRIFRLCVRHHWWMSTSRNACGRYIGRSLTCSVFYSEATTAFSKSRRKREQS